jgi:hypothetical protein
MKEEKSNNKKESQHSIIDICIRLKDMTLAVPNIEYLIEFSVIYKMVVVVVVGHIIIACRKYQMANC